MFKNIILACLLVIPVSGTSLPNDTTGKSKPYSMAERRKMPMITDLGLIKEPRETLPEPPEKLKIGVTITLDAYYKLYYQSKQQRALVNAGLLRKGANVISIKTGKLLEQSGNHTFFLETRAGKHGFKYKTDIDITVDIPVQKESSKSKPSAPIEASLPQSPTLTVQPPPVIIPGQKSKTIEPKRYDLSMFIAGRLFVKSRKFIYPRVFEAAKQRIQATIDSGLKHARNPDNESMITVPSAGLSISTPFNPLIKLLLPRKKPPPVYRPRGIRFSFMRKEASGEKVKVNAEVRLLSRVVEVTGKFDDD